MPTIPINMLNVDVLGVMVRVVAVELATVIPYHDVAVVVNCFSPPELVIGFACKVTCGALASRYVIEHGPEHEI